MRPARLQPGDPHYGTHMAHCNIGEEHMCKYGDDDICPALAPIFIAVTVSAKKWPTVSKKQTILTTAFASTASVCLHAAIIFLVFGNVVQ